VSLDGTYDDPVVVMGPLSYNGYNPCHPRLRNVDSESFEWKVEEWDYLDVTHPNDETVHYVVMEHGVHTLENGAKIAVGHEETDNIFRSFSYGTTFTTQPLSVISAQTFNSPDAIIPRQRRVEQESNKHLSHQFESMGTILADPGIYSLGNTGFKARRTPDTVTDKWFTVTWEAPFVDPVFVASIETFDDRQPAELRYRNFTETSVEIFIEEEQSQDRETKHHSERVDIMVFGGGGDVMPFGASGSSTGVLHGTTESGSPDSLTDTSRS
jgi:hypothetical protein